MQINRTAIRSTRSIPAEEVRGRLSVLSTRYRARLRRGDFQVGELPTSQLLQSIRAMPRTRIDPWLAQTESKNPHEPCMTVTTSLDLLNRKYRDAHAWARREITTEILHRGGQLLRIGPVLAAQIAPRAGREIYVSDDSLANLLLGGNTVVSGSHPISMHFVEADVTIDELHDLVANNEWPIFMGAPENPKDQDQQTVHDAPKFPDYMSLWHDLYHWIRHARWPLVYRKELPKIHDIFRKQAERFHSIPKDKLSTTILSGPEPLLYRRYGFYGALFFAISDEALHGLHAVPITDSFIRACISEIRSVYRNHEHWPEINSGLSTFMSHFTAKKEDVRLQATYWF